MAMTDQEQKQLRFYCAFLLKEYEFHFSPTDPVIPALYIIHNEMQSSIKIGSVFKRLDFHVLNLAKSFQKSNISYRSPLMMNKPH